MNNLEIDYMMQKHPLLRNVFAGVFAIDTLPAVPRKIRPAAYIVNTDKSYQSGEHWICVYFPISSSAEYFDSFGMEANLIFEQFMGGVYRKHETFLQNPLSTVCGQYCIAYIFMRYVCRKTMEDIILFFHRMYDSDKIINTFVEQILGTDLEVYDISFLREQFGKILK